MSEQKPYDENSLNEERLRHRRIKELLDEETFLKKERYKLSAEKPWYKKPEILVTIFGIIFPIIISYLVNVSNSDKKELTITYSSVTPIISESDKFKSNLVISFDSSQVSNISKLILKIKNTGNLSLKKSDFSDGPINFSIKFNIGSSILQANKVDDANQQNSELSFINTKLESSLKYLPSLLNKGDEVTIETYLLNSPTVTISLNGKLLDGNIIGPKPIETREAKIGYKTFILSLNSFFSYKWLTIAVLILIFIFTALSSIFQFAMASEDERDPKALIAFMGIVTSIVAILCIIFIVSTLIYT